MRTRAHTSLAFPLAAFFGWLLTAAWTVSAADAEQYEPAPEFTHSGHRDWINTEPLTLAQLRGMVVLVDFWTFGCWNCYRSFPWLNELEARFEADEFIVVGVHSPEFEHEKSRERVSQKVMEFGLTHPVMIDNDFFYWKAMNNRYWPTFYLIDKKGRIRGSFIGETHAGDKNARAIEKKINQLLQEPVAS